MAPYQPNSQNPRGSSLEPVPVWYTSPSKTRLLLKLDKVLHEASHVEPGAKGSKFLCCPLNPSWQGHRNLMDHRGSDQIKVLEKNMSRSSDCNPFSRTALGNSLLHSQQVKLLYCMFSPHYANPSKKIPFLPLSQATSMAMDGKQ